jgi:hypothetical protein
LSGSPTTRADDGGEVAMPAVTSVANAQARRVGAA